jgi:hypothetical protein
MVQLKDIVDYPDYKNYNNFLNNQYKATKKHISPVSFLNSDSNFSKTTADIDVDLFFNGRAVKLPKFDIKDRSFNMYKRFEDFTSKNEVNNISLWALDCLKYLSEGNDSQFGKELEVPIPINPRDARLDVVSRDGSHILILESKVRLKNALEEGRFKIQIPSYYKECKQMTDTFNSDKNNDYGVTIFLLIGGEETDLYPPNNPDCTTGKVGNLSRAFYHDLEKDKIKFISANALWCILMYSRIKQTRVMWNEILPKLFIDDSTIGLLSGGKVVSKGSSIAIEKFKLH